MNRYTFIEAEKERHPVSWLCRVAQVSRAAYYLNLKRSPSQRSQQDDRLAELIHAHHTARKSRPGARGHVSNLASLGIRCSRRRVRRLMDREQLRSRHARRFVRRKLGVPTCLPDLVERRFYANGPNKIWVGDITQIWTREGWAYLALLTDVFSRRIVGWALADHIRHELPQAALEMALQDRQPGQGWIHHSDLGIQYRSADYAAILRANGARQSAGETGICWDNALAESMNATLKKEITHGQLWLTRSQLRRQITAGIRDYNCARRHSRLGYLTPEEFEEAHAA